MRLYAAAGQRTEALRQYQDCVTLLDQELATPPEDETTDLYEAIKDNRITAQPIASRSQAVWGVLPPLPSLVVGREDTLREIKSKLGIDGERHPVTVIQGWPGVGKSTTVAALAHDPDVAQSVPRRRALGVARRAAQPAGGVDDVDGRAAPDGPRQSAPN